MNICKSTGFLNFLFEKTSLPSCRDVSMDFWLKTDVVAPSNQMSILLNTKIVYKLPSLGYKVIQ